MDEDFHREVDEAPVEQLTMNAGMLDFLRDQGLAEGSLLFADLLWQCKDAADAESLAAAHAEILDRVQVLGFYMPAG